MRDGCGRGNSLKLLLLGPQRVERDERHAIVGACHRTSNEQEHKIIHRAEPERYDFSLTCHSVQGARQPSSGRAISLGSFTGAGDFVLQLIRLESLGSELQESKQLSSCGSMCTDRKQPLNLPVMRMRVWIRHVYCINSDIGIYHTVMGKDIDTPVRLERATRSEADTLEE